MTRHRTKRAASVAITYVKPWSASFRELFDLVGESWTPPAQVKIRKSPRRLTMTAKFISPAGQVFTAVARCKTSNGRDWIAHEETLSASATFTLTPKAPAHG